MASPANQASVENYSLSPLLSLFKQTKYVVKISSFSIPLKFFSSVPFHSTKQKGFYIRQLDSVWLEIVEGNDITSSPASLSSSGSLKADKVGIDLYNYLNKVSPYTKW